MSTTEMTKSFIREAEEALLLAQEQQEGMTGRASLSYVLAGLFCVVGAGWGEGGTSLSTVAAFVGAAMGVSVGEVSMYFVRAHGERIQDINAIIAAEHGDLAEKERCNRTVRWGDATFRRVGPPVEPQ